MSDPLQAQITIKRMDAHVAAKSGDKDRARTLYIALASDYPDNKMIGEEATAALASLGYVDDAVDLLESQMTRIGDRQTLLARLAKILTQAQRWADASAAWRRRLAIAWDVNAAANLGHSLLMCGVLDEAETVLRKVVAADATDARAHVVFAMVLMKRGKTLDALAAVDAALAYHAKSTTHCRRGEILLVLGQPILAAMAFQRALDMAPDYPPALTGLAAVKATRMKRPESGPMGGA